LLTKIRKELWTNSKVKQQTPFMRLCTWWSKLSFTNSVSKHLEEEYKSTPYLPWYVNIARTCGNNIFPGTFFFKDMFRSWVEIVQTNIPTKYKRLLLLHHMYSIQILLQYSYFSIFTYSISWKTMRISGWNYCNLALLFLFYALSRNKLYKLFVTV
jgi:hypothetical protein